VNTRQESCKYKRHNVLRVLALQQIQTVETEV